MSLLQVDEEERWDLRFFDCDTLNFTISRHSLLKRQFDHTRLHLNSC